MAQTMAGASTDYPPLDGPRLKTKSLSTCPVERLIQMKAFEGLGFQTDLIVCAIV